MAESRKVTLEMAVPSESVSSDLFVSESDGTKKPVNFELVAGVVSGRNNLFITVDGEDQALVVVKDIPARKKVCTISGLKQAWGVAVNQKDQIIVVEGREHQGCVSIFSSKGEKIKSFGTEGEGPGEFKTPRGVAVDDLDNIFVVDKLNARIQKFTPTGEHIASVGREGHGELEFCWPKGIGVHPHSKNVYVTEANNHRVQILKSDLTFFGKIGAEDEDGKPRKGVGNGEFNTPLGVAFDKAGRVYVTDAVNDCIQVFTEEGEFITKFGKSGSGNGELKFPCAICIDKNDVLYVTEVDNHRVSVFTIAGDNLYPPKFLTTFGERSKEPFYYGGIAVGKQGAVYISDSCNDDLQIFLL